MHIEFVAKENPVCQGIRKTFFSFWLCFNITPPKALICCETTFRTLIIVGIYKDFLQEFWN